MLRRARGFHSTRRVRDSDSESRSDALILFHPVHNFESPRRVTEAGTLPTGRGSVGAVTVSLSELGACAAHWLSGTVMVRDYMVRDSGSGASSWIGPGRGQSESLVPQAVTLASEY